MNCRTCIFWDAEHSWIEEILPELQYVADCAEVRIAHCRHHSPNTYIVPEPDSPRGFKILSLFPVTETTTLCGDYIEDVNRLRSNNNGRDEVHTG